VARAQLILINAASPKFSINNQKRLEAEHALVVDREPSEQTACFGSEGP
jgi:hypothetical protein